MQIGNTKILRFVRSLEYETDTLDALIPRIPMVDFVISAWPSFESLAVEPFLESGFETEQEWYDHLADVGYFTEVTMCRYNAAQWPDLTNMPTAWTEPWWLIYKAAWEAWWNDLLNHGSGITTKLGTDGIVAALDMEAWDGVSITGATFEAWNAITEINGDRRNNYAWMANVPAGNEAYGNEVPVPRASINTYLGSSPYPIANVLEMIEANEPETATVWVLDPISYAQEGDSDGGKARYKAYVGAILAMGVELIILFPSVEIEDRPEQDAIIAEVWQELEAGMGGSITDLAISVENILLEDAPDSPSTIYDVISLKTPGASSSRRTIGRWDVTSIDPNPGVVVVENTVIDFTISTIPGEGLTGQVWRVARYDDDTDGITTTTRNSAIAAGKFDGVAETAQLKALTTGTVDYTIAAGADARHSLNRWVADSINNRGKLITSIWYHDATTAGFFNFTQCANADVKISFDWRLADAFSITASADTTYTEGSGEAVLDAALTVINDDAADITQAFVLCDSNNVEMFLESGGTYTVTGSGSNSLLITPKGDSFTNAELQAALRAITFTSTDTAGTPITFSFGADDTLGRGASGQRIFTVRAAGGDPIKFLLLS